MSTWKLLPDGINNFHWEISDQELHNEPKCDIAAHRLPSMADLLLLGSSKLVDSGREGNSESTPLFRTGLGNPIALKPSSIAKARSALRDVDDSVFTDVAGYSRSVENGKGSSESSPMFRTGLGKPVSLKQSSIEKARSVLRAVDDSVSTVAGYSRLIENVKGKSESSPMFRTGSGKPVSLKQSSIDKARSFLGDLNDAVDSDTGQFDGKGGAYNIEPISLGLANTMKPGLPYASDNLVSVSNSMFQTASGKAVNISSVGLLKAKTLLGLEENNEEDPLHCPRKTPLQSSVTEHPSQRHPHLEPEKLPICTSSAKDLEPVGAKSNMFGSDSTKFSAFTMTAAKPPPIKFHTAGGRSISVSSEALQRARSLLGNPEFDSSLDEASTSDMTLPIIEEGNANFSSVPNFDSRTPFSSKDTGNGDSSFRVFTSPFRSYQKRSLTGFEKLQAGNNLITQFDAAVSDNTDDTRDYNGSAHSENTLKSTLHAETAISLANRVQMKTNPLKSSSTRALVDISNCVNIERVQNKQSSGEKRRLGKNSYVSAFKKPRSSFVTPLSKNNAVAINAFSRLTPKEPGLKERVSMRYPPQTRRPYLKDFILQPPTIKRQLNDLPNHVRSMDPYAAESYIFQNEPETAIGPDDFYRMLSESGASIQHLTKEWISNHYTWIVWKLACYERCYPDKFLGKLLTVSNVLEELKYRYEVEVNHGYRSAIRKILDGDAPPSTMMTLCISSVGQNNDSINGTQSVSSKGDCIGGAAMIELTDGWYSVKAQLDEDLTWKLASGRLFLGQKLRIWGAKLFGWVGPISPSEASQAAGLILHTNGTYRCHWAERLGFCKSSRFPLAFRCIKASGGTVPCTLIGIMRIYPVLYKERLTNGSIIVRSERAEAQMLQLYNQRRSAVAEGIMSASEREVGVDFDEHYDCDGAKIMKLLETAAEPEVLMAGMSSKQLTSYSAYRAKLEARRHSNMQKSIEKAMEAAGLSERDVTPFFRVRVVGLHKKGRPTSVGKNGLITIWNPTEKQKLELCEGKAYNVGGLQPSSCDSSTIYLKDRGSTTNWIPLSTSSMENFEPFFTPRSSVAISNLGEVPLCSEFDTAALVVHVGEVYNHGSLRKQWVFVTDGSIPSSMESFDVLLAISFCLPYSQCNSFPPVNSNIAGSVVGFCNLIKRPRDSVNGLWVAEATENSDYFLSYDLASRKHLKDAAASVLKLKITSSSIEKLKKHIISVIR